MGAPVLRPGTTPSLGDLLGLRYPPLSALPPSPARGPSPSDLPAQTCMHSHPTANQPGFLAS